MIAQIASSPIRRPLHPLATEILRPQRTIAGTERAICEAIARHGQMTRDEIARVLGISVHVIHARAQDMIDLGILRGTSYRQHGRDRPMMRYSLIGCAP